MDKLEIFKRVISWNVGGAFLFFAAVIVVAAICVSIFASAGIQANLLMWLTALTFLVIAGLVMFFRAKELKKVSFNGKYNIDVLTNGFDIKKEDFDKEVSEVVEDWSKVIENHNIEDALDGVIVEFEEYPVKHPQDGSEVAGYTRGSYIAVGYRNGLKSSALAHELGHIIYRDWSGKQDQKSAHEFVKENNLR